MMWRGQVRQGMLVLLHVSGVGLLTLVVTTPTTAPLLARLGLTKEGEASISARNDLEHRVQEFAWLKYKELCETHRAPRTLAWKHQILRAIGFLKAMPEVAELLADKQEKLDAPLPAAADEPGEERPTAAKDDAPRRRTSLVGKRQGNQLVINLDAGAPAAAPLAPPPAVPKTRLRASVLAGNTGFPAAGANGKPLTGQDGFMERPDQEIASTHDERLRQARKIFLGLARQSYTDMVEDGVVPNRSSLAFNLQESIDQAQDSLHLPLYDWVSIQTALRYAHEVHFSLRTLKWLHEWRSIRRKGGEVQDSDHDRISRSLRDPPPKRKFSFELTRLIGLDWLLEKLQAVLMRFVGSRQPIGSRAYLLTCFINAHLEVQEDIKWMFGRQHDSMHAEVYQVIEESSLAHSNHIAIT